VFFWLRAHSQTFAQEEFSMFAVAFSDHLFAGFFMFAFLLWNAKRVFVRWDSGGTVRTTAKNKLISIITGWLK
jgi:hypothetical protein